MTRRPWLGLAVLVLLAGGVCAAGLPDPPQARVGVPAALALGLVSGVVLARIALALVPCDVPRHPRSRGSSTGAGLAAVLVVAAASEEVVWRGGAQAAIGAATGAGVALVLTALLFAAAHGPLRRRMATHLVTGVAFGTAFVVSGRLAAAIAAHGAYNLTLLAREGGAEA